MARWTDLAPWRGPTINSGDGDGRPGEPEDRLRTVNGLVVHIAEGWFEGTISWQRNPDADVSSHFVGARDGRRAQMVDTAERAWTQGAGNPYWISIEYEGFTLGHRLHEPGWHQLTDAQIEFGAQILARLHRDHGVPLRLAKHPSEMGLAYHSLGAEHGVKWGHDDCPGEPIKAQLPLILARAIHIAQGGILMELTPQQQKDLYRRIVNDDMFLYKGLALGLETIPGQDLRYGYGEGDPPPDQPFAVIRILNDLLAKVTSLVDDQGSPISDEQLPVLADLIAARLLAGSLRDLVGEIVRQQIDAVSYVPHRNA